MLSPVSHVAEMSAYRMMSLEPPAGKQLMSLSQNESLRPPSPKAIEAAREAALGAHLYPDPDWADLRDAIADLHELDANGLVCGNGSLDLIGAIARAYLEPGRAMLVPEHAYPFFASATRMTGARVDTVVEINLTVDVDALLTAVKPETCIVAVANPGNPTGTRIPRREILRLREGLPEDVILIVDEAYGEFADHLGERCFDMVEGGNTIVLRTFSKAYGLAAMRVGWGLFPPDIAGEIRKLLNPNNVALLGQASATAAMRDQDYMRETCAMTAEQRDLFATKVRAMGLEVPESFTNFVLVRFPSAKAAASADAALRSEGVFLRPQVGAGLPDCLRATVGVAKDMELAERLLKDWMERESNP